MKDILVPVDGSEHSKKAFEYALELAVKLGSKITILTVVQGLPYGGEVIEKAFKEEREKAEEFVDNLKKKAVKQDVKVERRIIVGSNVANEIVKFADNEDYDLIVIGSRGKTELETITLGSVSESVVKRSHIPVLVVR